MGLTYSTMDELDISKSVGEAFPGSNIIVRIRLDTDEVQVIFSGGNKPPDDKRGFPKSDVTISEPLVITVLPWKSSPGCKTVIVNGVAYERCS
jgi:hypothetical protein